MKARFLTKDSAKRIRYFIGNIRDKHRLEYATNNIDIVIHAAALKQVDAIEYNPLESIKTNIIGTQNVIDACIKNNVSQLIGISTDKSVSPCNLYGATKFCLEKLILSASSTLKTCVLRYGNVVGSRGSVIPILLDQDKSDKDFTITDIKMSRFTITQQEALNFIINCIVISIGGEIFISKLPKYTLSQLCRKINPKRKIKKISIRPGEKMHEVMVGKEESLNSYDAGDYYVILPNIFKSVPYYKNLKKSDKRFCYSSETAELITDEELEKQISISK